MRSRSILAVIASVAGTIALFLPFTFHVSPLAALSGSAGVTGAWRLALPFFLVLPMGILLLARSGRTSPASRAIAYGAALGAAAVMLSMYVTGGSRPDSLTEALAMGVPLAMLALGVWVWRRAARMAAGAEALAALQVVYVANLLLCLIGFWGDWQVGAYFSLVAAAAAGSGLILVARHRAA
jgi:hypothetical protein